uniref:Interleukin-15 receptor subunit alpha n=2 Tax=Urocitellus parryii TaxID=9999 RepID=A0A8D2GPN3_UROPR
MARRRFLGSGVHALRGLLLLLLLRLPVTPGTTCPTPMSVEHADIRVKSYTLNSRERYVCNSGFRRKAGTSSLTECVLNKTTNTAHWTMPSLKCIRDPSLTHQRPVPVPHSTVVTARVTPQPESPSPSGKDASSYSSRETTVIISTSVTLSVVFVVSALVTCIKLRRIFQPTAVEMENLEAMPMTRGSSSREEDQRNY